jgi:hypothetical protein
MDSNSAKSCGNNNRSHRRETYNAVCHTCEACYYDSYDTRETSSIGINYSAADGRALVCCQRTSRPNMAQQLG